MRIKIIGDNNCARATRHLLRLAGFAVTEFLPSDAVTHGPTAGYAITIDLAPALQTPDSHLRPDPPTHDPTSASEEAPRSHRDASSPAFVSQKAWPTTAGAPAPAIHFDSVDSALEAAVLRHVAQLAAAPVVVDRPGGVVHSDRELRIVAPNTGNAKADEAAAVAIEFGVLRGLLDLTSSAFAKASAGKPAFGSASLGKSLPGSASPSMGVVNGGEADSSADASMDSRSAGRRKKWWPFGIVLFAGLCSAGVSPAMWRNPGFEKIAAGTPALRSQAVLAALRQSDWRTAARVVDTAKSHRLKRVPLKSALSEAATLGGVAETHGLKRVLLEAAEAQGQFATGQGFRITDGTNFLAVDPCKAQAKLYASISQTANTQLVAGTASKKIYVCSIHVVAAAAANVAVVEGTGSVCATSTTGVSGFGGATAATGWNFAANGGIALGNGDSSLGAEGNSGDNLCILNSGSGQVSGGISYVVQ
jgi:hypothetical protein